MRGGIMKRGRNTEDRIAHLIDHVIIGDVAGADQLHAEGVGPVPRIAAGTDPDDARNPHEQRHPAWRPEPRCR